MFLRSTACLHVLVYATLSALACFAGLPSAVAQLPDIRVNVPFAFEADARHFEPGLYTIHIDQAGPILRITGKSQSGQAMFLPDTTLVPAQTGKIVFHRYGSQYFLREIWVANSKSHVHTLPSKAEKQLQLAANSISPKEKTGEELALTVVPN